MRFWFNRASTYCLYDKKKVIEVNTLDELKELGETLGNNSFVIEFERQEENNIDGYIILYDGYIE